jgi:iron complex outermembrane receptor protein
MQQGALNTIKLAFAVVPVRSMDPKNKSGWRHSLTTAEGESTIEDIDLETIGSIKNH